MEALILCYCCDKAIEVEKNESPREAALRNGWAEVSIRDISKEETFFVCGSCLLEIESAIERRRLFFSRLEMIKRGIEKPEEIGKEVGD